jgi:alkylation response protein AidB-like acyl-CoA dehydrogenase
MLVAISSEQEDDVASELVMVKQYEAIVGERSVVLAAELLGHRVLLSPPDSEARQTVNSFTDENWAAKHLGRIGKSISGGTSNIQRNIIAEQILGLPRDQRPS